MIRLAMMAVPKISEGGRISLRFEDGDCTGVDVVWELVGDDPANIKDEDGVGVDTRGENSQ
jgi:hypothetical protein